MASIDYITVINSYVSQEGVNGIYTNYVYYSLLVTYTNGSKEIISVNSRDLNRYASYIRTNEDSLKLLEKSVQRLEENIASLIDERVNYVVESMFHIPNVTGMNEIDAIALINEAGFVPVLINDIPEQYRKNSIIKTYNRQKNNFKVIELTNIIETPNLSDMNESEAVPLLELLGFNVIVNHMNVVGVQDGKILEIKRKNENDLNIELDVSVETQNVTGLPVDEAIEKLNKSGCTIIRKDIYSSTIPKGHVLNWKNRGDNTILLNISNGTGLYKTKSSKIKFNDLIGSPGDSLTAEATFDAAKKELRMDFYYLINSNSKHNIEKIRWNGELKGVSLGNSSKFPMQLDPGTKNHFFYIFNTSQYVQNIELVLDTSYGVLKKHEEITIAVEYEWIETERSETEKKQETTELKKIEREEKILQLKNSEKQDSPNENLILFLDKASSMTRFIEIKEMWDHLDFSGMEFEETVNKMLSDKAYIEKMYGGTTPQKIESFIIEIRELMM